MSEPQRDMEFVRNPTIWSAFLTNNGYKKLSCIGHGSFGDVYSVVKLSTGEKMAVKRVVSRHSIHTDETWLAESRALMTLDHANIVQLKEILVNPKMACLVMEIAPYGNLELFVEKMERKLEAEFIVTSFRQIAAAVKCCHDNDLAHRDINPSNVLVFSPRIVKLADFGLSFMCRDLTPGQEMLCADYLGHDSYLAPEVKRGQPFSAKPADVWSLGCLLFFLISCAHPGHNCNCNEIHSAIADWLIEIAGSGAVSPTSLLDLCHSDPQLRPLASDILLISSLYCSQNLTSKAHTT